MTEKQRRVDKRSTDAVAARALRRRGSAALCFEAFLIGILVVLGLGGTMCAMIEHLS